MKQRLFLCLLAAAALTCPGVANATAAIETEPAAQSNQSESSQEISTTTGGDINCNTMPFEIADLMMYVNFFFYGLVAFEDHIECSIANSDINGDGITLTIADLVWMVRVVKGDTLTVPPTAPDPAPKESQIDR